MEETKVSIKARNKTIIIAVLALLIALAAAIELVVYYRDTHVLFSQVKQNIGLLSMQNKQMQNLILNLQEQNIQQRGQLNQLQQLSNGNQRAWVLAEVNYLIHLASYNLNYTRDIDAGIALLQAADQRTATLSDPSLNVLRQGLVNVTTKLQAQPKVDVAGLLAKINALGNQVNQLPVVAPPASSKSMAPRLLTVAQNEQIPMWRKALMNSFVTFKSLIIVRHHNQPIEPLLDAEQQHYLQQNLQLLLQQASWAVLHGQGVVYRNSLQQAISWTEQYYARDAAFTRSFVQALKDLQKVDVQPTLPDMNDLLSTLQQLERSVQTKEG